MSKLSLAARQSRAAKCSLGRQSVRLAGRPAHKAAAAAFRQHRTDLQQQRVACVMVLSCWRRRQAGEPGTGPGVCCYLEGPGGCAAGRPPAVGTPCLRRRSPAPAAIAFRAFGGPALAVRSLVASPPTLGLCLLGAVRDEPGAARGQPATPRRALQTLLAGPLKTINGVPGPGAREPVTFAASPPGSSPPSAVRDSVPRISPSPEHPGAPIGPIRVPQPCMRAA
jgi:hypothetical protein